MLLRPFFMSENILTIFIVMFHVYDNKPVRKTVSWIRNVKKLKIFVYIE